MEGGGKIEIVSELRENCFEKNLTAFTTAK